MRERPPPPIDVSKLQDDGFTKNRDDMKKMYPKRFSKFNKEKSLKRSDELRNLTTNEIIYGKKLPAPPQDRPFNVDGVNEK